MTAHALLRVAVKDGKGRLAGERVVAMERAGLTLIVGLAKSGPIDGVITVDQAPRRFSLDQAVGLAEHVLAGDPAAITRPTSTMELAAAVMALYRMHTDLDFADWVADGGGDAVGG